MKNLKLVQILFLLITMAWATSCTESHDAKEYYCADVQLLCSMNLLEIMDNAGIKVTDGKVDMPQALKRKFGRDADDKLETLASIKGFDPRKIIIVYDNEDNVYAIAKLTDPKAFVNSFNDKMSKTTEGGYTILTDQKGDQWIIDGDMMVVSLDSKLEGAAFVNKIKANAESNPAKPWQREIIDDDETINLLMKYDLALNLQDAAEMKQIYTEVWNSMYEGGIEGCYSAMQCELKGLELKVKSKLYSADGNEKKCLWLGDKADKGMLKYMSANDMMVMLFTLTGNGWKSVIDNFVGYSGLSPEDQATVRSMYADLGGKFMLSAGYSSLNELMHENFSQLSITLAASVDGGATSKLDQIESLLKANGLPYSRSANKITIVVPGRLSLYLIADGDNLVVSLTDKFAGSSRVIDNRRLGDDSMEFMLKVPGSSPAITYLPLPFGIEIQSECDDDSSETVIRLTDTEGNLLENIINFATKF